MLTRWMRGWKSSQGELATCEFKRWSVPVNRTD